MSVVSSPSRREEIARNERLEVLADAFKIRAGVLPRLSAHPEARLLVERGSDADLILPEAVYQCTGAARPGQTFNPDQAFAHGWRSTDFGQFLGNALADVVLHRQEANVDHRAFCSDRPVKNFHPVTFPSLGFQGSLEEVDELGEVTPFGAVARDGLSGHLKTYATALVVSRETIRNDHVELLTEAFAAVGAAAARREARTCYGLLESNPTLADGAAMFHADHGNLLPDVMSLASLGTAMRRLRDNPLANGEPGNLAARVLLVSSDLELSAINMLAEIRKSDEIKLIVVASPLVTPGRWYLFADPTEAPVIGRLTLRNSKGVNVGPTQKLRGIRADAIDGLAMKIAVDHGFVPLDRVGAVRGGL